MIGHAPNKLTCQCRAHLSFGCGPNMRFLPKLERKFRRWKKLKKPPLLRKLDTLFKRYLKAVQINIDRLSFKYYLVRIKDIVQRTVPSGCKREMARMSKMV